MLARREPSFEQAQELCELFAKGVVQELLRRQNPSRLPHLHNEKVLFCAEVRGGQAGRQEKVRGAESIKEKIALVKQAPAMMQNASERLHQMMLDASEGGHFMYQEPVIVTEGEEEFLIENSSFGLL